jgi:hypothetical protein
MDRKTQRIDEYFDKEIRTMAAAGEFDQYRRIYPLEMPSTHRLMHKWVSQGAKLPKLEVWVEPISDVIVETKPVQSTNGLKSTPADNGRTASPIPEVAVPAPAKPSDAGAGDGGAKLPAAAGGDGGAGAKPESTPTLAGTTHSRESLMAMTKGDLLTLGAERGVDLSPTMSKPIIVSKIMETPLPLPTGLQL